MNRFGIAIAGFLLIGIMACCRSVPLPLKGTDPSRTDAVRVVSAAPLTWPEAIDADEAGNLYFTDHWEKKLYRLVRTKGKGENGAFRQETLLKGLGHVSGVSIDRGKNVLYCGAKPKGEDGFGILVIPLCLFDKGPFPKHLEDLSSVRKGCGPARWIGKGGIEKPNGVVFDSGTDSVYFTVARLLFPGKGHVGRITAGSGQVLPDLPMTTPNGIDICPDVKKRTGTRLVVAQTGRPHLTRGGGVMVDDFSAQASLPGLSDYHPDGIICTQDSDLLAAGFVSGNIICLPQKGDNGGYQDAVSLPLFQDLGAPTDLVLARASSGSGTSLYVTTTTPWQLLSPLKSLEQGRVIEIRGIQGLVAGVRCPSHILPKGSGMTAADARENRVSIDAFRALRGRLGRKDPVFSAENLNGPLLFAHRGGVLEAPESTARAFRYALDVAGADVLELDVQITKDGRFVVWHGPGMDNVFIRGEPADPKMRPEDRRQIHHFNWGELEKTAWVADPGTTDLTTVPRCNDRRLLLLEDFLQRFPDAPLNIEMKATFKKALGKRNGLAQNVAAFYRILTAANPLRTVVAASADAQILQAFRQVDVQGRFPTNLSFWEQVGLKLASPSIEHRVLETIYLQCFSGRKMVEKVHGQGRPVYVFITGFGPVCALDRNLEDSALFEILDRGVDGIMTDRPRAVREAMHRWLERKIRRAENPGGVE